MQGDMNCDDNGHGRQDGSGLKSLCCAEPELRWSDDDSDGSALASRLDDAKRHQNATASLPQDRVVSALSLLRSSGEPIDIGQSPVSRTIRQLS